METSKHQGRFDQQKAFLRGGIWKNFFSRYPESNWMNKRMLGLSEQVQALQENDQHSVLLDLLYQAQANDVTGTGFWVVCICHIYAVRFTTPWSSWNSF